MSQATFKEILIPEADIQRRIAELGDEISRDYQDQDLVLLGVLKGSVLFLADLTRHITIPHTFDFIGASSYGAGTTSSGLVKITRDVTFDLKDKHVLLVEDIYDTGHTMDKLLGLIELHEPATLQVCSFLLKDRPRPKEHTIHYTGFTIPNHFVVGYGLDLDQHYRHLRDLWLMETPPGHDGGGDPGEG